MSADIRALAAGRSAGSSWRGGGGGSGEGTAPSPQRGAAPPGVSRVEVKNRVEKPCFAPAPTWLGLSVCPTAERPVGTGSALRIARAPERPGSVWVASHSIPQNPDFSSNFRLLPILYPKTLTSAAGGHRWPPMAEERRGACHRPPPPPCAPDLLALALAPLLLWFAPTNGAFSNVCPLLFVLPRVPLLRRGLKGASKLGAGRRDNGRA